jgi:hypothetical protein
VASSRRFIPAVDRLIRRAGVARDRQRKIALRYREGLAHENEQFVLSIVEPLLTLVKLRVVGIVVLGVLAPRARCVVCSRSGRVNTTIDVETQTCELGESVATDRGSVSRGAEIPDPTTLRVLSGMPS